MLLCDSTSTSSNWNYYNSYSYDNWWLGAIIYWNYLLFLGPLISIESSSDYQINELGLLITIGGLVLVGLGIASLAVSWGLLKGKGWARMITLIISIIAIIFAIISCKQPRFSTYY